MTLYDAIGWLVGPPFVTYLICRWIQAIQARVRRP